MPIEKAPGSRIAGVGSYVPLRVLTNHDLEQMVDTSDEWITERTGIKQRHIAADGENTSDMATRAAERALAAAGMSATDLDMIIVGTVTGDMPFPACAAFVQQKLGARPQIPSFDVSAACAGFLYGVSIADQFVRTGNAGNVLVVGAELLSRITDWEDRQTCVLFGDGAGAVVIAPATGDGRGILSTKLYTDASLTDSLCLPAGGTRERLTPEGLVAKRDRVKMVGSDIFRVAVRNLTSASKSAIADAGLSSTDVDWLVPHQANLRIINGVAQRLDIPNDRFIVNISQYGNTSSASIPIALDEAIREDRIKPGHTVVMCALGAGISWASALVRI
jgi:3-oxoacyl-[acyl-carrier-protein] synthase-3